MISGLVKRLAGILLTLFLAVIALLAFLYFDKHFGLTRYPISISGTGSMYPTFAKGQGTDSARLAEQTVARVSMRRFPGGLSLGKLNWFTSSLKYGDIISFENAATRTITKEKNGQATGFVKRVIALSGDVLEIRDGFVWRNNQRLLEEYTASARSTFGGMYLPDCQKLAIPEGYVFVLGDNRKSSNDSRHDLGLVAVADIDYFLPLDEQEKYAAGWRDASGDASYSLIPVLDKQEYLQLLNQKRRENNLPQFKYDSRLELSASKRADVILKYDDLSFTATKSGYTMEKAMADAGYGNIVWGEAPTLGYYDSQELIDNYFEFPGSRKFLLNADFQETGLSVKVGELHGCPVQIVVQHFAGYKPPDYTAEVISSWETGLSSLQKSLTSWEKLKTYPQFYNTHKGEIDELLEIFAIRINRFQAIVSRMKANQWLTDEQEEWMNQDEELNRQMTGLIDKLNSY